MYKLLLLLLVSIFNSSWGDDTSLGKCTDVVPVAGFNMNRFLGKWYAIQSTGKNSPCLSYYIAPDTENESHYKITEIEQHTTIWSSGLHHEHNITGDLTIPDPSKPGRMALDLPLDIGTTTFTVFLTDYDNYAAIFTCKKYPLLHKWGARILSRTHTLDMAFVDKVRTRLSSYNLDPFELKIVSQSLCPKAGTKGSIVKTVNNVVTGVKNAAYDVVEGVEGTVKSLISDPSIGQQSSSGASESTERTFDVRAGEKIFDVIGDVGEKATGVVNSIEDTASKTLERSRGKLGDIATDSKHFLKGLDAKISDATRVIEDKINSINEDA